MNAALLSASPEAPALQLCDELSGAHLRALEERLGAPAMGLLDLPPLAGDAIETDQLRAVAPLYWALHAEQAGLLAVVEALSQQFVQGAIVEPIGRAGHLLFRYFRDRHERFKVEERASIYSHLFGGQGSDDPNHEFAELFPRLAAELDAFGRSPTTEDGGTYRARISSLAGDLTQNLSPRTAGVVAFAARDVVDNCRQALTILRDPELQTILGGGSVWLVIRRLGPRLTGHQFDPEPQLSKGVAGMRILRWIADVAGSLAAGPVQLQRGDAVVLAASDWLMSGEGR